MMCKQDQSSNDFSEAPSSPPPAMRAGSELYGSDGSESDEIKKAKTSDSSNNNNNSERRVERKMRQLPGKKMNNDSVNDDTTSTLSSVLSGVLVGVLFLVFALNFPFMLSGQDVGDKIYQKASFEYDPAISLFDNTIWTYGTDYALATITGGIAFWILNASNQSSSDDHKPLARASATMLFLYAISTGAGAIAHHNFLTVESRNSMTFRLLWTICVGTVFLAPTAMGIIGNECLHIFQARLDCPPLLKSMPRVTDIFWVIYGAVGTIACALGFMSFQRPACDIFIAGITQIPCTFYCMAFIFLVEHPSITKGIKIGGLLGFIMNAILLPLYPILVVNLGWSLAATNTLLHSNLCVAWSLQGLTLLKVVKILVEETKDEQHQEPSIEAQASKKVQ